MKAKFPRGTLDRLWSDPANWKAGCFYHCKADPRGIVPKRQRWAGWTLNSAQPSGWFAIFVMIGYPLGVIFWLHASPNAYLLIPALGILPFTVLPACKYMASTDRFEE